MNFSKTEERFLRRCLELAASHHRSVTPNPMVAAVIAVGEDIIGEGAHLAFGGPHAEVNALGSVKERELLKRATLYLNLEPCCHHGKTPPCTDLILNAGIPRVVVSTIDPNEKVQGKGLAILKGAGVEVKVGELSDEAIDLNKRFFVFHQLKRPYIILKWAETKDHFIAKRDFTSKWISNERSRKLVHTWRGEENAVLVGTTTALMDNPRLTVREASGENPIRLLVDMNLEVPSSFHLFDEEGETWIFNGLKESKEERIRYVRINSEEDPIKQILSYLFENQILSVLIEGGSKILKSFITRSLWDEARVFISEKEFIQGIAAPSLESLEKDEIAIDSDRLIIHQNRWLQEIKAGFRTSVKLR